MDHAQDYAVRLLGMELEVETVLTSHHVTDLGVRNECSIVRGILELVINHGVQDDLRAVEKRLARIVQHVGTPQWSHRFLLRLRRLEVAQCLAAA